MQCRTCKNCDWKNQYCPVWGVPLSTLQSNPDYTTLIERCYEPMFVHMQGGQPTPQPQGLPVMPAGYAPMAQPAPQQYPPPYPPPRPAPTPVQMPPGPSVDDVRMANMFAGAGDFDPETGKKKKTPGIRGIGGISGILGKLVNIIVWGTLAGTTAIFFAIAGYSLAVPQIVIRQGDIPAAAVAVLAVGTLIALFKGVTIIREDRNAA